MEVVSCGNGSDVDVEEQSGSECAGCERVASTKHKHLPTVTGDAIGCSTWSNEGVVDAVGVERPDRLPAMKG